MGFLRRIGLFLFIAGIVGLAAYPAWFAAYHNIDLGTYRVYDSQDGFPVLADISLSPRAAPLSVELTGRGTVPEGGAAEPNVTLVINGPDGTVAAEVVTLALHRPPEDGAAAEVLLQADLSIDQTLANGPHRFVLGEGDGSGVPISFLDMSLTGAVAAADARVRPAAYGLLGAGLVLMVIAGRGGGRRKKKQADPADGRVETSNIGRRVPLDRGRSESEQPTHQWGRGDGEE